MGKVARGSSDNPGGRPRIVEDIRRLAREHTETAIKTLCRIAERGKQEATRVASATTPLDRGWGRPTQPVAGDDTMPPVALTIEDKQREIAERQPRAMAVLDAAFGIMRRKGLPDGAPETAAEMLFAREEKRPGPRLPSSRRRGLPFGCKRRACRYRQG